MTSALARGYKPETVAMDKGYDNTRVYAQCEERGCDPVIPMRGVKGKQVVLPIATGGRLSRASLVTRSGFALSTAVALRLSASSAA